MGRYSIGPQQLAYGTFWYSFNQNLSAISEPGFVYFDSAGPTYGIALSATNTSKSKNIVFKTTGVYNVQFSAQVIKDSGSSGTIDMWFKKNGTNLPSTAGYMTLDKQQKDILGFDIIEEFKANDVLEMGWRVTDTAIQLDTLSADGAPASPSIILTVQQI